MRNKSLLLSTALLFSSAFFVYSDVFYGEEATTPGKYKMTYEVDGKVKTVIVEVKPDKTEMDLKDVIIGLNEKWTPLDNVVSLKDKDGEALDLKQVRIKSNVNTQETGIYYVKFSYKSYVSVAKVVVTQLTSSYNKKRAMNNDSFNNYQTKIILNDELLKEEPIKQKMNVKISGGSDLLCPTNFGNMLSFLSGTLLYGTRRV
ncbi:bacterial Ig-like domain-containing protein [Enterococcus quebecensis]|uniref:Ig-like domain-containing protein n=1 Tax=Enterococcus quebecensis TaxID=903983 RepID=A0A1E5GRW5_9ENTE|nr:bacterial Ig-like domain-containing protein [Enterococcus quebecensis]OEG15305.1 hypothetical protein BCR23_10755 [Enterococcus quebecensis]OJG72267.1 hypothetical protein RV12_GL000973 [Enterococcus quebecensis]